MVKRENKFYLMFFSVAAIVVFLDQLTKFLVSSMMSEGQKIGGSFSLFYTGNTGTAFGLFSGSNALLIWLTIFIIGAMLYFYADSKMEKMNALFLSLVFGGAIGNLIDRIVFGQVTDFISIVIWPVFNLADLAITVGVIGLIVYYWKK
jgi:signal peptidase II